jgi:diguanylate cyclase (GGDEF)-like protein
MSLRSRMMLLVLLAVVPAIGLMAYNAVEQHHHAAHEAQDDALTVARFAAQEEKHLVAGIEQMLLNLAQFPAIQRHQARHCRAVLADLARPQPYYANLGVADIHGRVWCSALPLSGAVTLSDRGYFHEALATGRFAIGEYQIGRITGKPSVNFGMPVRDVQGQTAGVVFAALDLVWFNDLIAHTSIPPGTNVTVVDGEGTVLARYPDAENWVGRPLPNAEFRDRILAGTGEGTFAAAGLSGNRRLFAYLPLSGQGRHRAVVVVGIPESVAFAESNAIVWRNIGWMIVLTVMVLAIAWYGTDRLVMQPVTALAAAARRLGEGNLFARTGLPHGATELGQLAQRFDDMADALERRERRLNDADVELRSSNRALAALSASNQVMLRSTDETAMLREVCQIMVGVGGYRFAWVVYADDNDDCTVTPMAWAGIEKSFIDSLDLRWSDSPRGHGPAGTVLRTGQPVMVRDVDADPNFAPWRDYARRHNFAAVLALPLRIEGRVTGAFIINAREKDTFDEREIARVTEMVDDLAFGITALRLRAKHAQAEARLEHTAYYDALTDLPNFQSLLEHLQRAMDEALRRQHSLAVLSVNLDRFKEINEALGFEQGDALLAQIGPRLIDALRDHTFVARIHGDAFGVLLPVASADQAEAAARQVETAMRTPFLLNGVPVDAPVTVGITVFPGHGDRPEQLIRRADVAMRHARQRGQTHTFYSPGWDQRNPERLALAGELRHAIENGELTLLFQPKIDIRAGVVSGVEALARWRHPRRGDVTPDEFIRVAEHTGLIRPLTDWVLEAAMQQAHRWRDTGLQIPIAVNLSVRNLHDPALPGKIKGLMSAWNTAAGALEIEITESAIMDDPEHTFHVLAFLHELGIRLLVDDFGTGYSSLSYLKHLPVDGLKIDKSFTSDMLLDKGSDLIVRSTIELAHNLSLEVVAEGVETQAMLDHLRALQCDAAQGYHIARPIAATELLQWLRGSPWSRANLQ